jgi:hypothetical protein
VNKLEVGEGVGDLNTHTHTYATNKNTKKRSNRKGENKNALVKRAGTNT